MAEEYHITCAPNGLPSVAERLRRSGGIASAQFPEQIEFRFRNFKPDEMPDAMAVVEADGIYFLDNGSAREEVAILFRQIIDEAINWSGPNERVFVTGL